MKKILSMFLLLIAIGISYQIQAAEDDKPFAEERIVLQISDSDPFKQTLVLMLRPTLLNITDPTKLT